VRSRADSGFTMVELIVAMVILVTVLLALITVQVRALQGVALAKQRQQATAYANQAMERMRALPYGTVTAGLNSTDLAGDPNLTGGNLVPACGASGISEPVVTTGSAATAPLYPHVQTIASTATVNVSYKVSSYVTLVSTTAGDTSQGYWLTAIANWPAAGSCGATKTVRSRSQLFSPSGCLATATHPFSGPCQAFYDGAAASTPAGITVSSAGAAGTTPFTNNDLTSGGVSLPSLSAAVQSEETISASGQAATSGAQYSDSTPPDKSSGAQAASTGASTDPTSGTASTPAAATVTQTGASALTKAGSDGKSTFTFTPGAGDAGKSASTTAATALGNCNNLSDVAVASVQACSSSAMTPGGTTSASLTYGSQMSLGSVAATATPSRAFTSRYVPSGASFCTGGTAAGCISSNISRALDNSVVGGVPGVVSTSTSGFSAASSMVTVTGYTDAAKAESSPTVQGSNRAGVLTYWSGAGFTTLTLAAGTDLAYTTPTPVVVTYLGPGGTVVTLSMTDSVTVTPASLTTSGASCQPVACTTTSTSGTVVAAVTYTMSVGGSPVGFFTATLTLGSAMAKTSYRAAPSA
jgi:prepilin-type N-terminal cleavage/methylation domain-containing protein